MKRLQEEMTRDQLEQKRRLLEELEESEQQAKRVEQYLHSTMGKPENERDDVDSINSEDFPPTHGEATSPVPVSGTSPKRSTSTRQSTSPTANQGHKKSLSYGGTVTGSFPTKLFGRLSHAVHGIVDVDPETTRRNNIGKTRENIVQVSLFD
jgi:sorting nexin-41/42